MKLWIHFILSCTFSLFCCVITEIITLTLNQTVKVNCSDYKVIEIDNITTTDHAMECQHDTCTMDVEDINLIRDQCNGNSSCYISHLKTKCLRNYGYISFEYTCEEIEHSCDSKKKRCDWTKDYGSAITRRSGKDWKKVRQPYGIQFGQITQILSRCDFEKGRCGWTIENGSDFTWTIGNFRASEFGPNTPAGNVIYTAASKGYVRDTTVLGIKEGNGRCLTFWYHPFGNKVDILRLYLQLSQEISNSIQIWNASDIKENKWHKQKINLHKGLYRIVFEAERIEGSTGYIALDNIRITNKACKGVKKYSIPCLSIAKNIKIKECGKHCIQPDQTSLKFYPNYEKCRNAYTNIQHLNENSSSGTVECNIDVSNVLQKNPECFMPNKLDIEYSCKVPLTLNKETQTQDGHDKAVTIGGVIAGITALACVIAVLIVLWKRSANNKREKNVRQTDVAIPLTDDYTGNQSVAMSTTAVQVTGAASGKDDLQHVCSKRGDPRTDDDQYTKCTYMESTHEEGDQTGSRYEYVDTDKMGFVKKGDHENMDTNYSSAKTDIRGRTYTSKCRVEGENNSKSNITETYTILDPNETGFNRSNNDNKHLEDKKSMSSTIESNDDTYDTSNKHQKESETNIYSHAVDDVYDSASQTRENKEGQETYDHFLS